LGEPFALAAMLEQRVPFAPAAMLGQEVLVVMSKATQLVQIFCPSSKQLLDATFWSPDCPESKLWLW
jgi:hypothetical protein